MRDDASAISKQDKGKGTEPFLFISHHPATAGWYGNNGTFAGAKVWVSSFSDWGQFCEPGPYPEPTIIAWKMGKISPPVKNWVSCEKAGGLKSADLLWKLEDLAGNRSGIRCCGLLFGWASLGDPASFIPLKNRNGGKTPFFLILVGPGTCPSFQAELPESRGGHPRALLAPDLSPGLFVLDEQVRHAGHARHAKIS